MSFAPRIAVLLAAATLALPAASATTASAKPLGNAVFRAIDTDNDGTIDLKEVQTAAEAAFAKLDPDNDGTLDKKELKGRLKTPDLKAADPDGDGTIDKKEYLALVEGLFKQADPDGDGTLDDKELKSEPGRALIRLIK